MLPHYLVKFRWSIFGISGRKCKQKCTMHWFLNTHTILMHLAYLLTCCFNFQFLLSILCKQQTVLSKQVLWTKQRFLHVWHGIDQTIIDYAIDEWSGHFRGCVRAKGGQQVLWQYSDMWQETFQFLSNITQFWIFFVNYHKFELLILQDSTTTYWRYGGKY